MLESLLIMKCPSSPSKGMWWLNHTCSHAHIFFAILFSEFYKVLKGRVEKYFKDNNMVSASDVLDPQLVSHDPQCASHDSYHATCYDSHDPVCSTKCHMHSCQKACAKSMIFFLCLLSKLKNI